MPLDTKAGAQCPCLIKRNIKMKEMQDLIKERRVVFAGIEPASLVEYFQPQWGGYLRIPEFPDIPKDAVCTSCHYEESVDLILFRFYHKSFEKVPSGNVVPIKFTEIRLVEFTLKND